jgi:hypothetical protein
MIGGKIMITRREILKAGSVTLLASLALSIVDYVKTKTWNVFTQQEWIHAFENAIPGDTIFVHPGTYKIENAIPLDQGIGLNMINCTIKGGRGNA